MICQTCPFAFTHESEVAQSYGCLPSPFEIVEMRKNGKTWACHDEPETPCVGAIAYMKEHGMPHKVVDPVLVTESSDWSEFL